MCQARGVMHRVGHLCNRTLDAKRKSNQGAGEEPTSGRSSGGQTEKDTDRDGVERGCDTSNKHAEDQWTEWK